MDMNERELQRQSVAWSKEIVHYANRLHRAMTAVLLAQIVLIAVQIMLLLERIL